MIASVLILFILALVVMGSVPTPNIFFIMSPFFVFMLFVAGSLIGILNKKVNNVDKRLETIDFPISTIENQTEKTYKTILLIPLILFFLIVIGMCFIVDEARINTNYFNMILLGIFLSLVIINIELIITFIFCKKLETIQE